MRRCAFQKRFFGKTVSPEGGGKVRRSHRLAHLIVHATARNSRERLQLSSSGLLENLPPGTLFLVDSGVSTSNSGSLSGTENVKVDPSSGTDSAQIVPPRRSTIFLTMASPIPVPWY